MRAAALAAAATFVLLPAALHAQPAAPAVERVRDAVETASGAAHFEAARAFESAGQLAEARRAFLASLEADPGGRWARRAQVRANALEGAEDPATADVLAEFARVRTSYSRETAEQAWVTINALSAQTPSGPVRAELDEWIAREALHVRRDPLTAWQTWARSVQDPATPPDRVLGAIDGMLDAAPLARKLEQTQAIIVAVTAARPELPGINPARLEDEVRDARQRAVLDRVAGVLIPLFAVAVLAARPWRSLTRKQTWTAFPWRGLLFITWLFVFAAFLSENWHDETGEDVLSSIPIAWACHLGAWLVGRGEFRRPLARATTMLIVVSGSFAALYAWFRAIGQESFLGF